MKKFAALILAAVCILSLAACSAKPEKEICIWMNDLKAEDITTVSVWSMNIDKETLTVLSTEKTAELVSLLNKLTDDSFTENSECVGGTPEYGIVLEIDGEYFCINQSIAPPGALETEYGDKLWWIDNDELTSFVKSVCEVTD